MKEITYRIDGAGQCEKHMKWTLGNTSFIFDFIVLFLKNFHSAVWLKQGYRASFFAHNKLHLALPTTSSLLFVALYNKGDKKGGGAN